MKINGHRIEGPNRDYVVIPRGTGDIVFTLEAVLDMEPFEKMCPVPKPPLRKMKGGVDVPNLEDVGYKQQITKYAQTRLSWIVLTSLRATEGLEWESVDLGDQTTWVNFREEMRTASFTEIEIDRVVAGAIEVNGLSEAKIDAARERFLIEREVRLNESISPADAQVTTPSGVLANASE